MSRSMVGKRRSLRYIVAHEFAHAASAHLLGHLTGMPKDLVAEAWGLVDFAPGRYLREALAMMTEWVYLNSVPREEVLDEHTWLRRSSLYHHDEANVALIDNLRLGVTTSLDEYIAEQHLRKRYDLESLHKSKGNGQ